MQNQGIQEESFPNHYDPLSIRYKANTHLVCVNVNCPAYYLYTNVHTPIVVKSVSVLRPVKQNKGKDGVKDKNHLDEEQVEEQQYVREQRSNCFLCKKEPSQYCGNCNDTETLHNKKKVHKCKRCTRTENATVHKRNDQGVLLPGNHAFDPHHHANYGLPPTVLPTVLDDLAEFVHDFATRHNIVLDGVWSAIVDDYLTRFLNQFSQEERFELADGILDNEPQATTVANQQEQQIIIEDEQDAVYPWTDEQFLQVAEARETLTNDAETHEDAQQINFSYSTGNQQQQMATNASFLSGFGFASFEQQNWNAPVAGNVRARADEEQDNPRKSRRINEDDVTDADLELSLIHI